MDINSVKSFFSFFFPTKLLPSPSTPSPPPPYQSSIKSLPCLPLFSKKNGNGLNFVHACVSFGELATNANEEMETTAALYFTRMRQELVFARLIH